MERFKHNIICDKWIFIGRTKEGEEVQIGPHKNNGGRCTCGTDSKIDIWNEALNEAITCVLEPTGKRSHIDVKEVITDRINKLKQEK